MALFLYPLLLLVASCGGAAIATVNKDGQEYTTGIITAQSNEHNSEDGVLKDLRHAMDVYCYSRGGGYDPIDKEPTWDPTTKTKVTKYDKCEALYEKGIDSCDRYSVTDGYILKDEKNNGCWIMHNCKETSTGFQFGEISGSQRFRCFKK